MTEPPLQAARIRTVGLPAGILSYDQTGAPTVGIGRHAGRGEHDPDHRARSRRGRYWRRRLALAKDKPGDCEHARPRERHERVNPVVHELPKFIQQISEVLNRVFHFLMRWPLHFRGWVGSVKLPARNLVTQLLRHAAIGEQSSPGFRCSSAWRPPATPPRPGRALGFW